MHSSMWWVMSTTVMPLSRQRRVTVEMTSSRPRGSSMAVGSSRTMILGRMAMTPAIATRCFCPPESRCGAWVRYSYMPTCFKASSTRSRISALGTPRFSGAKATSSSTTLATSWLSGFWKTMPTRRRISKTLSSSRLSMPSTMTLPESGVRIAFICLASVDLPLPLWPRTATKLPSSISRSTPQRLSSSSPG